MKTGAIPCAVILCDDDSRTGGQADDETDEQIDNLGAGADGGQRTAAYEIAYDKGICGVVKLLEQIPDDEGACKQQNRPGDGPFSQ